MRHRIGIHLGDVVEESDGDLMGDGVNIAARLEGIAKPNSICLSEDAVLHLDGATHGINYATKFNKRAIACPLHDAALIHGDGRIDQAASERPQPRQYPVLVGAGKPAISDYIRYQNRREFPGLGHGFAPPLAPLN
jgi:adenylate cyclase